MKLRFMSAPSKSTFSTLARMGAAVMCAISVASCGSLGRYPAAPVKAEAPDLLYKIGALDVLSIVVWRNPELSSNITVRPDGRISLPLVEDLQAAGRNPADLSRDIEKALSKFIRDPIVTVVVNSFQGVSTEQIRIVGEASKPQSVPFRKNLTILDVMIQAGGLTDFANGNGAVLIRGSQSGAQYSLRLKDLLKGGDISANVEVMPGDIIIVPQSWF